jgi:sulfhydrogenase subunit gamma (sulfur reductase)
MNLYQPHLVRIDAIVDETPDTRTLRLAFKDDTLASSFDFKAGQFGEYSVFGWGESTFCIASSPTRKGAIECTFKAVGKATKAMRELGLGDEMGFRGPYGNAFPLDRMEGASLVFIAGGIGLAPVRCVIWNALDLRDRFKDVTIVYGARTVSDLVYKRELEEWQKRTDVKLWQTVDPGGETPDWPHEVGFVPPIVEKAAPSSDNAFAIVCGPPVMIKYTLPVLARLGFADDRVYTTLENRMKCGIGKCGRCNVGPVYVCKDGPVFSAAELARLPQEY